MRFHGLYSFIDTIEYGYVAVILLMTYSLSNTIVEAAMTKDALRKSEERFRSLVETTSDWVWEVDKNGVSTYASPKVRDLLGYELKELMGKTPFDLMPRTIGQIVDITESKRTEDEIRRLNAELEQRTTCSTSRA